MEADEMMDDDLFADLYGDEEPKKQVSNTTKSSAAPNGTATAATASEKPAAQSVTSAATVKGGDNASDPPPASGATTTAAPQTQQANTTSNENHGQENVDEDSYQGWESQQNKGDASNGGNNDYQGYNGYEQDGDGYGDYSGGNSGNMVDVGGSTAIKEDGKMFIGGLNWETTDESLKNYFSQFGEVTECTVMRDGTTGRSRGFGFLTFKDPKTVNIVMVKEHYLDQKIIDPKRAIPRDEQEKTSKIFVGGVSQEATEADFREYFMQFGRVLDATLMMDKDTGRPRGFGFVTFDSEGAVENALNHPNLEIMGKAIEVKKAQPRGNPRDRNAAGGHYDERDDSRGGFNRNDRRGFERDGSAAGPGAPGYGPQGPNGNAISGQPGSAIYNGMSPAMMAQYWSNMQRYVAVIMQQQAAAGRGRGMPGATTPAINPMMMNPAMMNPQMMQQMQLAQQTQGQMPPNAAGMGPMGMNGMGGMGAQGMGMGGPQGPQQHQQGPQGSYGGPQGGSQGGYGPGGYGQQHEGGYDHSQQQQHGVHPHGNMGHNGPPVDPRYQRQAKDYQSHHQRDFNPQQGPSSWEGMYDDVPAQQQGPPQHQHHQSMNNAHTQNQQHHQHPNQPNRMPPAGPSFNPSNSSGSTPQPTSGPPPNAPTGPRNARNPAGPGAFRGPGGRGAAGPGMQGGGGIGPMRGPGGFSRGAAVGGIQQPGGVGGHGYHPYARNNPNQGGGGGDRGGY